MSWCFAKVNNKLAEIYFEKNKKGIKMFGHCYISAKDYKSRKEQKWMEMDTGKFQFTYNKGKYKDLNNPDLLIY